MVRPDVQNINVYRQWFQNRNIFIYRQRWRRNRTEKTVFGVDGRSGRRCSVRAGRVGDVRVGVDHGLGSVWGRVDYWVMRRRRCSAGHSHTARHQSHHVPHRIPLGQRRSQTDRQVSPDILHGLIWFVIVWHNKHRRPTDFRSYDVTWNISRK